MLRLMMIALLISTLCTEYISEKGRSAPTVTFERILWWLPENTETLIVSKGPYTFIDSKTSEIKTLKHRLEQAPYGPLSIIQRGKFLKPLLGQTILLSVEGSRKFRPPSNLGSMLYDGCHVFVFGQDFSSVRDSFIKQLEPQAKEVQTLAGHQVMVFEEMLEGDLWKIFIASPQPDVILCATDQSFLTETLNRINLKAKNRALPESLPEWKQVDTTAQFWAIRHYDKENALIDTTSPLHEKASTSDKQAVGVTLTYNPNGDNEARIKYLSGNTEAAITANKNWNSSSYKLNAKINSSAPGVVEVVINPDNPAVLPILLLSLFSVFGHALYI